MSLNSDQLKALTILEGDRNVFLTGAAGSGKSYLMSHYLRTRDVPVLASTGAAAILIGGRTFHSFFGLGILEGGPAATVERALKNKRLLRRLKKAHTVVIDEISMISGPTLAAAERIAARARGGTTIWGGLRVIAVGDFAQLPPVNRFSATKEWAFLNQVWAQSEFQSVQLNEIMRTTDRDFLEVLNRVRLGQVDQTVTDFLNTRGMPAEGDRTRLFPHRADVERFNLERLREIPNPAHEFPTEYAGGKVDVETFKKHAPVPETITLKIDALIMIRQNDPEGRWVNGSLGHVVEIHDDALMVQLLENDRLVEIERTTFTMLNADGEPVATAENFPVSLAWAMTIHKAQGASLDRLQVSLSKIWEPGQAYVALSRARSGSGLYLDGWAPRAIFADPQVARFHQDLEREINP